MIFSLAIIHNHIYFFFFFNDTATTEIYTLSLHDALPIFTPRSRARTSCGKTDTSPPGRRPAFTPKAACRSEEHTSELQSQSNLVCRLLLEKKKTQIHDKNSLTMQHKRSHLL